MFYLSCDGLRNSAAVQMPNAATIIGNQYCFQVIIGNQYCFQVMGLLDVLIDYYVAAVDNLGNVKKTDIYHAYIGNGSATCTD